jgi:hypothetical protein
LGGAAGEFGAVGVGFGAAVVSGDGDYVPAEWWGWGGLGEGMGWVSGIRRSGERTRRRTRCCSFSVLAGSIGRGKQRRPGMPWITALQLSGEDSVGMLMTECRTLVSNSADSSATAQRLGIALRVRIAAKNPLNHRSAIVSVAFSWI